MFKRIRHQLAHKLDWHLGRVVSAIDRQGTIWIGFRCSHCGRITGIHASVVDQPKPEEFH